MATEVIRHEDLIARRRVALRRFRRLAQKTKKHPRSKVGLLVSHTASNSCCQKEAWEVTLRAVLGQCLR